MILSEGDFLSITNNKIDTLLSNSQAGYIAAHLCKNKHAKRARPLLCLYFHWLFEEQVLEEFIDLALTAEFIHAASLFHDDVVDEANMRRGKISANGFFGNSKAVLGGDYLLCEAFGLLKAFDRELINKAIDVVKEMTLAALIEINARGHMGLREEGWASMARGKTGVLFSWCGFAAANWLNRSDDKKMLWQVGEYIGQLFQMVDDLKDFSGDRLLKDQCRDIRNKEPSLPVILAAEEDQNIMKYFEEYYSLEMLTNNHVEKLRLLVLQSGAIKKIEMRMHELSNKILTLLKPYEKSHGHDCLLKWVDELIKSL